MKIDTDHLDRLSYNELLALHKVVREEVVRRNITESDPKDTTYGKH